MMTYSGGRVKMTTSETPRDEAIRHLKALMWLVNDGWADEAIQAEAASSGRPVVYEEMSEQDARAWFHWLQQKVKEASGR